MVANWSRCSTCDPRVAGLTCTWVITLRHRARWVPVGYIVIGHSIRAAGALEGLSLGDLSLSWGNIVLHLA